MQTLTERRKAALVEKLKTERDSLVSKFGKNPDEFNVAIEYLETGKTDKNPNDWELLDACMNDLETMFNDYDC